MGMPTTSQFDPIRHNQYMKARDQMGMALQEFRSMKRLGGSLIDQRVVVQASMLIKALDLAMKRAAELQSGKTGEADILSGTKSKVQHLILTIDTVQRFSIAGLYEPQKEEAVQKCQKHLTDGLERLQVAKTTLADVTLPQ